jgi:hypothetical protein
MHEYGWAHDDVGRLGQGTAVGHLLECAGQLCGGYFADPGRKEIPGMANLGFPFADVAPNGEAFVSKVAGTGGAITVATATEQLLYEVTDPHGYLTPDVTADFSRVTLTPAGPDRIAVRGATGRPRPGHLKVSVGYLAGYVGEGEIGYAGMNAEARGRLAAAIVRERLGSRFRELRIDLIGSTSLHGRAFDPDARAYEVRLRIAGRAQSRDEAAIIGDEVEALYTNGPAGGGGVRKSVTEQIGIVSTLVDRARVPSAVTFREWGRACRSSMSLAHCRAGDKGNTSTLSLIAYRADDYPLLARRVTAGAVARHLAGIVQGDGRPLRAAAAWRAAVRLRGLARRWRDHVARPRCAWQVAVVRAARNGDRALGPVAGAGTGDDPESSRSVASRRAPGAARRRPACVRVVRVRSQHALTR